MSPQSDLSLGLPLTSRAAAAVIIATILAGCAGASPNDGPAPALEPVPSALLKTLSPADINKAGLSGELGCSFSHSNGALILVAMGNVASHEAADGIIKPGSVVQKLSTPGGFDAMLKGATFSGRNTTVRISLSGPPIGNGESPPRPATLTFEGEGGIREQLTGRWSCGP